MVFAVSFYLLQLNMTHSLVYSSFQRNICGVLELFSATLNCRQKKGRETWLLCEVNSDEDMQHIWSMF